MKTAADYSIEDKVLARSLPSHYEHGESYGVVHIQRKLKLGYNRASYVLELALEQGCVVKDQEKDWLFRLPKS